MRRRELFALLGAAGAVIAGGIAVFKPEVIIGSPRGEGEPVSIERTITDNSITYQSSTNTVRYPTLMSSNGPVEYETVPFERWANRRCASIGSEAVLPAIQNRFEKKLQGIGKGVASEYLGLVITVSATTTRNRAGKIVSEPNIPFRALVEAAPRTVSATVRLEDQEHTRSVPVFVEESELAYL